MQWFKPPPAPNWKFSNSNNPSIIQSTMAIASKGAKTTISIPALSPSRELKLSFPIPASYASFRRGNNIDAPNWKFSNGNIPSSQSAITITSKGANTTLSRALSLTRELQLGLPRELSASHYSIVFQGSSNLLLELHHACHHDTPLAARKCGDINQSVQHAAVGQPAGNGGVVKNNIVTKDASGSVLSLEDISSCSKLEYIGCVGQAHAGTHCTVISGCAPAQHGALTPSLILVS